MMRGGPDSGFGGRTRKNRTMRRQRRLLAVTLAGAALLAGPACNKAKKADPGTRPRTAPPPAPTATPVKHMVVVFQENVSFDHYFGTYPHAANPPGEPAFTAKPNTPAVNGLTPALLDHNPNAANPRRLDRSRVLTCDQDHRYSDEQKAFNHGLMDRFVESVGSSGKAADGSHCSAAQVLDYYDGNTVTALWNYAQRFAMSDNSFATTFGPSTPGALNLIAGQAHGVDATVADDASGLSGNIVKGTLIGDPDPMGDKCSGHGQVRMTGTTIGNLLSNKGVTWGWFEGGFRSCSADHAVGAAVGGHGQWGTKPDYLAHHQPFQYFASTANPDHVKPSSVAAIGTNADQANHQYDLSDFWAAVAHGNQPAVSFLKAPGYQDGHAGYSDPLDEQRFLVDTLNRLQRAPTWKDTAVVIAYDDSDGWYDHQAGPIANASESAEDALTSTGECGKDPQEAMGGYQGRCGYGPRLPLLVLSPFARSNFVDHTLTDQTSVLRFIEDNWSTGRIGNASLDEKAGSIEGMLDFGNPQPAPLILDPASGAVARG
jgi:phospholipase C